MSTKMIRMISDDEYSDYRILGLIVVECDDGEQWLRDRLCEWRPDFRLRNKTTEFCLDAERDFYEWLTKRDDVDAVEFQEWHIVDCLAQEATSGIEIR